MMLDRNLLQALREHKRYDTLYPYVPLGSFTSDTRQMLKYFGLYFKRYPEHEYVELEPLGTLIRLEGKLNSDQLALFGAIIEQLKIQVSPDVIRNTLEQLNVIRYSEQLALLVQRYKDGDEVDLVNEVQILTQVTKSQVDTQDKALWADGDIWEYIQAEADDAGYMLDCLPDDLTDNLKGLTSGKNVCVAMPTDKGKTSLFCAIAVCLARQHKAFLDSGYELAFRPVLYLINEGTAEAITPRVYQTALVMDGMQLYQLGKEGGSAAIVAKYEQIVGRRDAIRLVNIHGMTTAQVARIIEAHNPFCVLTDMTGRIRCLGAQGINDINQLEAVWDTMRQFAAIYDFFHIGSAQISAEGFDTLFPPLSALQNSKTGIQTTIDLAIWGGALVNPDPKVEFLRGFSTPKNKLKRTGKKSNARVETIFNPDKNTWK